MVDFSVSVCRVSAHWRFASGALHFNEAPVRPSDYTPGAESIFTRTVRIFFLPNYIFTVALPRAEIKYEEYIAERACGTEFVYWFFILSYLLTQKLVYLLGIRSELRIRAFSICVDEMK